MAECGIPADHSTLHRWALKLPPVGESISRPQTPRRQELVRRRDLLKVIGDRKYLYRAADRPTFLFRAHQAKTGGTAILKN